MAELKKVRIKQNTRHNGKIYVADDVIEMSKEEADRLINLQVAIEADKTAKISQGQDPEYFFVKVAGGNSSGSLCMSVPPIEKVEETELDELFEQLEND